MVYLNFLCKGVPVSFCTENCVERNKKMENAEGSTAGSKANIAVAKKIPEKVG